MARTILHDVGEIDASSQRMIPVARWSLLVAIAIGGSLLYGASLSLVLPGWSLGGAALWLTLSAGFAWCVLIPMLWLATPLSPGRCLDACLVTMAAGEVVLASGALMNAALWWHNFSANAALINALVVGISNIAMAAIFAFQLQRYGVTWIRAIALWMLALNGSGAVFFAALYRWFHGA